MYVARYMSTEVTTVRPETSIPEARALLSRSHFRHLPVIDDTDRLAGMVTDRDLRSAYPSSIMDPREHATAMQQLQETSVSSIMTTRLHTLTLESTLDDALLLLDREKIGGLPVLDREGKVAGFFSIRDLTRAYSQLFGIGEPGSALIAVTDDGNPRPLTRIVRLLEERDIHFNRLVRSQAPDTGEKIIYIRVQTYNISTVHQALQQAGFEWYNQ